MRQAQSWPAMLAQEPDPRNRHWCSPRWSRLLVSYKVNISGCLLYTPSSASELWLHRGRGMFWRRKEKASAMYERLSTSAGRRVEEAEVPRGHVPVLVGMNADGAVERFVVPLRLFQDPRMATLLDMSAQEFGYRHPGILRIPCDVDHFRRVIGSIDKAW
ncbi:Auxin responsive protein [Musa troglodytarum]|uniref:Auxin responsive protein n=1 Tax=Musa troglodytarum TaxID=320322 RepID=A0A9E7HJX9_9LILI|nr:Auxin responsive protein [Musa troglodytarum]